MSRNTRPVPYQTIRGTATLDMHGNPDVLANGIRRTDHSAAANSTGPHPFLTSRRTQLQSHQGVEDTTHQEEHADCDSDRCNDDSDSEGSSSDDSDSDAELYQSSRRVKGDTRGRAHSGIASSNARTPTTDSAISPASNGSIGRGNFMDTSARASFPSFNGATNISIMGGTFTSFHNAPVGQTPAFFDGATNVSIRGGTFGNVNNTPTGQTPFSPFFNGAANVSIGGNATFISGNTTYSMSSQPSTSNSRDDERAMRREIHPNAHNVRINGFVRRTYHTNGEHHRMNGAVWDEAYHSKYGCY